MVIERMTAEERRLSIVEKSLPLFAEKGFAKTTTKDIANAAGVSEALLYKHFPSKESLYTALHEHCCVRVEEQLNSHELAKPSTETLILLLYYIVRSIVLGEGHVRQHLYLKRLMINSFLEDGQFAKLFIEKKSLEWEPALLKHLKVAQESGDIADLPYSIKDRAWFAHHLAVAISMMRLPGVEAVNYENKEILDRISNAALFCIRGVGVKDEAIKKYFKPEKYQIDETGLISIKK
ncbi:MAG: TetR/AcrR family transcriptional regulator [Bdellovibrionales bacterium]|nr:TetR/AcrR family transcriptional regulator [Bdellovibrionales bacterium]